MRMDRSVIDVWRAEEREISEILYHKLMLLTTIHSSSEEFRRLINKDMFLKPNQKALLHVTHYLFMLLDATEFKKRFYWPISDKKSEAIYRSSTVQYLSYLNEKHNLNWTQLTNYLTVMPGGLKFMLFLIDLMDFVVNELINRSRKVSFEAAEKKDYKQFNLEKLTKDHEYYKLHISSSIKKVSMATDLKKKQIASLKKKLEEICTLYEMTIKDLVNNSLQKEWEKSNKSIFASHLINKRERSILEKSLSELKVKSELILSKKIDLHSDKNSLHLSYKLIEMIKTNVDLDYHHLFSKNELNFQVIIRGFFCIMSTVDKMLCEVRDKQDERWQHEKTVLDKTMLEYIQLKNEILSFQDLMKTENCAKLRNISTRPKFSLENTLQTKFINTPPISFDIKQSRAEKPRLLLLDDNASQVNNFTFTNQTTLLRHKFSKSFRSIEKNKCKIIDPLSILKTVKRLKHLKGNSNLSALGPKWKERELMIEKENQNTIISSPKESLPICLDSFIQTGSNNQHSAPKENVVNADKLCPSDAVNYQKRNISGPVIHESFDDFNFLRATTSPSGRLESLIKVDNKNSFNAFNNEKDLSQIETASSSICSEKMVNNIEMDDNATFAEFNKKSGLLGEDKEKNNLIFDISDSVLRDVSL